MKRMIALTTAAAIALTSFTATPAAALDRNAREFLGVLLGMAVLGAVINEANKGTPRPRPQPQPFPVSPPREDRGYYDRSGRYFGHREDRTTWLPSTCLRTVRLSAGNRDVVSAQCLRDEGFTARLPTNCAFDIRTDWGTQRVYGTSCLADAGFKVARR